MRFLEKDLESIIYEASQTKEGRNLLIDRNLQLRPSGKMFRQVSLGTYGIADLVDVSIEYAIYNGSRLRSLCVEIIELKRGIIDYSALGQACRYLTAIKELCQSINHKKFYECNFHITLIGSKLDVKDDDSFVFLYNELRDGVDAFTYNYTLNGISFNHISHNWRRIESSFCKELEEKIIHPKYSELRQCIELYDFRDCSIFNN